MDPYLENLLKAICANTALSASIAASQALLGKSYFALSPVEREMVDGQVLGFARGTLQGLNAEVLERMAKRPGEETAAQTQLFQRQVGFQTPAPHS